MPQTTILPPWPPADPTQALDWDQRGCCGPLDTCGNYRKLHLRYDVIGHRFAGPVGPGWGWIATGQAMIADANNWSFATARAIGAGGPLIKRNVLVISPKHELPPRMDAICQLYLDLFGILFVEANAVQTAGYCAGLWSLPVTSFFGPPDPPDEINVFPIRWFRPTNFPFLG